MEVLEVEVDVDCTLKPHLLKRKKRISDEVRLTYLSEESNLSACSPICLNWSFAVLYMVVQAKPHRISLYWFSGLKLVYSLPGLGFSPHCRI